MKMTFRTSLDGSRTRVEHTTAPGEYVFTTYGPTVEGQPPKLVDVVTLSGDEAQKKIDSLTLADNLRFVAAYGNNPITAQPLASGRHTDDIWARPLSGTVQFDVHTVLHEFKAGDINIGEATRQIVQRVEAETHGQVAHHLADCPKDEPLADLAEFYKDLSLGE